MVCRWRRYQWPALKEGPVELGEHSFFSMNLAGCFSPMHWHFHRKVILIWDRWSVHQASTRYFEQYHPDCFQFEELPGYSPELNPVEQCWKHVQ